MVATLLVRLPNLAYPPATSLCRVAYERSYGFLAKEPLGGGAYTVLAQDSPAQANTEGCL